MRGFGFFVDDAKLGPFPAVCKDLSPIWKRKIPKRVGRFPLEANNPLGTLVARREQKNPYDVIKYFFMSSTLYRIRRKGNYGDGVNVIWVTP